MMQHSITFTSTQGKVERFDSVMFDGTLPFQADREAKDVSCAGGAMDYMVRLGANTNRRLKEDTSFDAEFWYLAQQCRKEYLDFVNQGFVQESVRLFDLGMKAIEILEVVEKEADNPRTLGRAYTCGVSNMGIFQYPLEYAASSGTMVHLREVYYATSHGLTGSLYQLSCGTVGKAMCLTFQFPHPIVRSEDTQEFADAFIATIGRLLRYNHQRPQR